MVRRIVPVQSLLDTGFEHLVHATLKKWHVPGMAVSVVDGEHTWAEGYGISSFPSTPVKPSTLFYGGSTTKAFTAAAMGQLVDDSENYPDIQWKTPVNQLIRDDFVLADEYATNHITIEDILSHRTGLPRHDASYGNGLSRETAVRDVVRSSRHLPLTAEPRTKYQYCNTMFVAASHVIESVTGEWLGDRLEREIWKPLEMNQTYFELKDALAAKEEVAKGYAYPWSDEDIDIDGDGGSKDEKKYREVEYMDMNAVSGAGAIITNVIDYAKWARSLMYKTGPLSDATRKAIWEPRTLIPDDPDDPFIGVTAYALGWSTGVYQGHRFYEHSGGVNAFMAELVLIPDLKFSVALLGNVAGMSYGAVKKLAFHLIDEKLGVPAEKRFDWDKYYMKTLKDLRDKNQNAVNYFYPTLPSPHLPATLPISSYVGTYSHPAYRTLKIYFDDSKKILRADRKFTTWPEELTFEHVSGDYFLMSSVQDADFGSLAPTIRPAEFVVGPNGQPSKIGVGYEEEMGRDARIWFERV